MAIFGRLTFVALTATLVAGFAVPGFAASETGATGEFAAQRRPQITIFPRHRYLPPNARRRCETWLAQEYRVSGTVVVPQMRCWWER